MDHRAFFDELKAGTVRNVYLFYGPEAHIRRSALEALEKKILSPGLESLNRTVLTGAGAQAIIESCETMPMMSDYRLIIVRDCALLAPGAAKGEAQESALLGDYIAHVPPSTCLVFDAGEAIDRRKKLAAQLAKLPGAVSFEPLDDAQLHRWINQTLRPHGKRMGREACDTLLFTSGRDLTMLTGELEKLAAYCAEREEITPQDIEAVATHTAECTVFAMVDALTAGQAQQAFALLGVLLTGGEQRAGILAMITRQYRQMMYCAAMLAQRMPQAQMAQALGVRPFVLRKLTQQVGRRGYDALRAQVDACVKADLDFKSGKMRDDAALDRLMLLLLEADQI